MATFILEKKRVLALFVIAWCGRMPLKNILARWCNIDIPFLLTRQVSQVARANESKLGKKVV